MITAAQAWENANAIRDATLDARRRCADNRIAASVSKGRFRIELIDMTPARTEVLPLTEYLPAADAVSALNALRPPTLKAIVEQWELDILTGGRA